MPKASRSACRAPDSLSMGVASANSKNVDEAKERAKLAAGKIRQVKTYVATLAKLYFYARTHFYDAVSRNLEEVCRVHRISG